MPTRLPSPSVCNPAHEDPLEVHLLSMVDDHLPVTLWLVKKRGVTPYCLKCMILF